MIKLQEIEKKLVQLMSNLEKVSDEYKNTHRDVIIQAIQNSTAISKDMQEKFAEVLKKHPDF